jgi:hypothetical protein
MSKIKINKDKYFLEAIILLSAIFDDGKIKESKVLIPIRQILKVWRDNYPSWKDGSYILTIDIFLKTKKEHLKEIDNKYSNVHQSEFIYYKTKKERDEDWEKLKNIKKD